MRVLKNDFFPPLFSNAVFFFIIEVVQDRLKDFPVSEKTEGEKRRGNFYA